MTPQIITERLTLIACPLQVARAASGGRRQLETLLAAHVDDHWLDVDGRGLLSYYDYQLRDDPTVIGWGLWLIMHTKDRTVFGSVGFKGKPDENGEIEIGYGISPRYRRQGYTFEAAQALVAWGFENPDVKLLRAECLPNNVASARILEKLGMTNIGIQSGYVKWNLRR